MQMNLLNMLQAASSGTANTAASGEQGSDHGDAFAQLLQQEQHAPQSEKTAAVALAKETPAAAIAAQEVGQGVRDIMAQEITPELAEELMAQLDAFIANGGASSDQRDAFAELRKALEQVVQGDQPVTVSELVAELPTVGEVAEVPLAELAAANTEEAPNALMRVLGWMHQAIDKRKEVVVKADDQSLAALTSGVPAAMFRPADDASAESMAQAAQRQEKARRLASDAASLLMATAAAPILVHQAQAGIQTQTADGSLPLASIAADTAQDLSQQMAAGKESLAPLPVSTGESSLEHVVLEETAEPMPQWLKDMMQELAARNPKQTGAPHVLPPEEMPVSEQAAVLPEVALPKVDFTTAGSSEETTDSDPDAWLKNLPFPLARSEEITAAKDALDGASNQLAGRDKPEIAVAPLSTPVASSQVHKPAQPHHAASHYTPMHLPAADQVQVAIRSARNDGLDKITIQLEPMDLGRVEVRMHVAQDGRTQIQVFADKASTLDMLSRDAHGLERSLAESGIKADAGSMQFNLRQQPQFVQADAGGDSRSNGQEADDEAANDNAAPAAISNEPIRRMTLSVSGGLDIHA